jgi:hypothetical protein
LITDYNGRIVVYLLQPKHGYACDIFNPRVQSQETNVLFLSIYVDDRSESSSTYDMIIGQGRDLLGELGIIMNFNDHTVTWDTDNIPMNDRRPLSSVEALIEIYMSGNEPQTLRDEYSWATTILDAEYKPASLDDVIKTCENLYVEEQHQLKILLQKYEPSISL